MGPRRTLSAAGPFAEKIFYLILLLRMLPEKLSHRLRCHLEKVKVVREQDLKSGYGEVFLPYALARKYPKRMGLAVRFSRHHTA